MSLIIGWLLMGVGMVVIYVMFAYVIIMQMRRQDRRYDELMQRKAEREKRKSGLPKGSPLVH